jgi:hypothetical protein
MTVLVLGVIELPYADDSSYRKAKTRKPKSKPEGSKTTGDIAEILEDRYHPMENFFDLNKPRIVEKLIDSYEGALESILMGAPATHDPAGEAVAFIEDGFKRFITEKTIESLPIPGIPTQAAQEGHSHRFKHPYAKRAPRPSLLDTGLYIGSFKAWFET